MRPEPAVQHSHAADRLAWGVCSSAASAARSGSLAPVLHSRALVMAGS